MAYHGHSDLEVVPQQETLDAHKFAYHAPPSGLEYNTNAGQDTHKIAYDATPAHAAPKTICGLRKRTFWIIVAFALIVIAAAVGGGVGGALTSKSTSSSSSSSSSSASSSDTSTTSISGASSSTLPSRTSSTPSVTTTPVIGPTTTIQRDCPSSNNTIYAVTTGDNSQLFRKQCSISLLNANGIASTFGRVVPSLNACIDLCGAYNIQNRTAIQAGTNLLCNAVCWRNTFDASNDWPGGMCFGYTTLNSSGTWRYRDPVEARCDMAGLMNQEF